MTTPEDDFIPQVFRQGDDTPNTKVVPVTPVSIGGDLDMLGQLFQMPNLTKFGEIIGNIKDMVAMTKGVAQTEKNVTIIAPIDDAKAGVLVDNFIGLLGKIPTKETMTVTALIEQLGQHKPMLINALKEWTK